MSWSDMNLRRLLPVSLAGFMTCCGFQPIHVSGNPEESLYGQVAVREPDTPVTFRLVQEVESRLGRAGNPAYFLEFTLHVDSEAKAISVQNTTLRYSLIGTLDYVLTRRSDGEIQAAGKIEDFVSYSAVGTPSETLSAERDAVQRLAVALSNQLVASLYGALGEDG